MKVIRRFLIEPVHGEVAFAVAPGAELLCCDRFIARDGKNMPDWGCVATYVGTVSVLSGELIHVFDSGKSISVIA